MIFNDDEEALDVLSSYGHRETQNGVIRGEWASLNEECVAAVFYLCDEWDFTFVETPPANSMNTE